ncbi:hypothetical protein V495_08822 [Pseudogymnoascus sp. VKM F-4514 (FW-929)]|nr:hypothetical protein V495_08822 [Pseudogymnoascus sp. VKM F-4514 (FW-929)]KFY51483.1 hypothetical protein V497_09099 [Pseudogymnoascus sp. VKM F-4516 (FW-969)]
MPPQTRRTHTKSRGGCLECKRRKLKCDEEKPVCSGCIKRSIRCEFAISRLPSTSRQPEDSGTSPVSLSAISSCDVSTPSRNGRPGILASPGMPSNEALSPSATTKTVGNFDMDDMALYHQFITETAATMGGPWVKEVPRLSISCDYLMHGMLSTAALHLAYLHPGQRGRYEFLSTQHRTLALGPFQQDLLSITPENCNQVLAFSGFMIIAQFAPSCPPEALFPSPSSSLYKGPANWIVCLRGCSSIVTQARRYMISGPLEGLISQGMQASALAREVTELPENEDFRSLQRISGEVLKLQSIKETTTVDEMESYIAAISWLQGLLAASLTTTDSLISRIFSSIWPTQVSDTFIRTLGEGRPPALIITAHYCLLLQRCYSCWYMEHRAYDLFKAIQQDLPTEWGPYIERMLATTLKQQGKVLISSLLFSASLNVSRIPYLVSGIASATRASWILPGAAHIRNVAL